MRRPVLAVVRSSLLSALVLGAFALALVTATAQASFSDGDRSQTRQGGCGGDQDCDGVPDSSDACPTVQGPSQSGGCPPPDRDADGTPDSYDQCPDAAGPSSSGGCPDADADGIPDSRDACPNTAAQYTSSGCPDADRDGVPDSSDKCPTSMGPPETNGCDPNYIDPNDSDGDGVANADDQCSGTRGTDGLKPNGCGPFRATGGLDAQDLKEMGDYPSLGGSCGDLPGKNCTLHLKLTLTRKSAQRIGLGRKIADADVVCRKRIGGLVVGSDDDVFSKRVTRAMRRAYENNIPLTMTLSGTYSIGSGDAKRLATSTFTMKRKPQGGAYRVTPSIWNGDEGPGHSGLTRESSEGDF